MKVLTRVILSCFFLTICFASQPSAENSILQKAKEFMADRKYQEAAEILEELLLHENERKDEELFLLGNAYFYRNEYERALERFQQLRNQYPDSRWVSKALFRQAECYARLRRYQEAEEMYAEEVARLVSAERKEELAKIYLNFAEEYFNGSWVKRHERQGLEERPDYAKAREFYALALRMELSAAKSEEVRLWIARCDFELQNYQESVATLKALQKEYPEGEYLTQTLYYLGQSYLKLNWMLQARQTFRDFVEDYPAAPKAPEAAFLISRTYGLPSPYGEEELELGVKSLEDFLTQFPDDALVPQVEYEIGLSFYNYSRYDDALAAFQRYLEKYENPEVMVISAPDVSETPEGTFTIADGLPLARYYLGKIYQQQRKYSDAIAAWQRYLQTYPSHNLWSEAQRQIVETEYLIADKLYREENYEAARAAWEQFLTDHPLDPRNPMVMFRIGESYVKQDVYQEAIAQWQRTVSKYPDSDPASQAQFEIGHLLESKLGRFEEAFAAYKLVSWGSYAYHAQERMREMQAKRLTVLTERSFRTNETPKLKITTRNIERLNFKVYRVDLESYFRKMQSAARVDSLDIALIDPDQSWEESIGDYEAYRQFETAFTLPFSDPGAYLITCSEQEVSDEVGYEATTLVLVSDLDIIFKSTKRDALVFAQNMREGKVSPDVTLLFSDGEKIFFEGSTAEDGVFHRAFEELKEAQDVRVFAYDGTHYASNTLDLSSLHYVDGLKSRGYIYSDRPAYRPGQHVNVRAVIREADEQGVLRIPADRRYTLQVLSSQGSPVYQEELALGEFGTLAVDFQLSAAAPLGEYRVLVTRGDESYSGQFLVEEYRLEKVKLTIESERDVYFRGETIKGTIRAEYYYGEPLKDKTVTYSLTGLETQSGTTDENGEISFSLSTRDFAESQPLSLHARLDDENVEVGKTVWLATRGFSCELSTLRSVYLPEEDIEVRVNTLDAAGNGVGKNLSLGMFKRERGVYGENVEVRVDKLDVVTDGEGNASVMIRLAEGGQYVLRAEGEDRFGNPVSGRTMVIISGDEDETALRLFAATEEFKVGEDAEVNLFSRASEGLGLLTYEGESILSYQVLDIAREHNRIPLTITSEHAPNFTLAVAQMEGNRFHRVQKEFLVLQQLDIQLTALKADDLTEPESFKPGERVRLEISASDQNGKPVSAEISLAMVDEALYAQYADLVPPIRDFFYRQRREFATATDSSCTFSFEAQIKEIVTAILDEKERMMKEEEELAREKVQNLLLPSSDVQRTFMKRGVNGIVEDTDRRFDALVTGSDMQMALEEADFDDKVGFFLQSLREYFPETGYWNPSIVTDEEGKAVVELTLPDSTTEWRFTSRGISRETLVGESTAAILTKLPFFADIKTPSVLTEGDKIDLLASLHNYSGNRQEALLSFRGTLDSTLLQEQEQSLGIAHQAVSEIPYQLDLAEVPEISASKRVSLELSAEAGMFQDRIKRDVPLRPWGIEYVSRKSGTLRDDRQLDIALPQERPYAFYEMRILLNPALDRTLVELADDRPWPFKAPASSTIHEAQVVLNAIRSLEYSGNASEVSDEASLRALQGRLKALLVDIALQQKQDGSWSWTGAQTGGDLFVSADAVTLLSKAEGQGYTIRQDALEKGVRFLQQAFQSARDNDIKSYLLYALSVANDVDFAHVNRVYRERNSLHSNALAYLSLIYSRLNRPEIATELNALLLQQARVELDTASGKEQISWSSKSPYPWLQDEVELTALALSALQEGAEAPERLAGIVDWLYAQRCWFGWGSMRSNARMADALLGYFSQTKKADSRYTLQVTVNGNPLAAIESDRQQGAIALDVPADWLKSEGNTIAFDFEGRGSVTYVCLLQGLSRDVRQSETHYTLTRHYEPALLMFQGKEIPRGFSVLSGSHSVWRNAARQIPLGGFGRVTLEYQRRDYDREYPEKNHRLILEEPLPAGCTVLEQSLKGGFTDYEIQDGKILFYLNNARYASVSYDLYGYLPGEYKVLPAKIQAPYLPERRDYSEPYALTVLERGKAPDEEYKKTPDELYYYGKALFETQRHAEAGELLRRLFGEYRLNDEPYRESAKMLMYIAIAENNSSDIVQYFEVMKERFPNLVLSFEDILRVGRAYREIGEYERAVQVFRATAEASFLKDVQISGSLEAQREFFASLDYTRNLLMEYPDIPITESSFYALAQLLLSEAARSKERSETTVFGKERQAAQEQAIGMLREFLTRYPENPIADEVAFSLANAYIELEEFETVVALAQVFQERYPKSPFLSAYQYIEAYGNFELERYERSLELCRKVATGKYPDKQGVLRESDHKELAIYIMGQLYHSMGDPEKAIAEYEKVEERFPDAKEAIGYFRRKALTLDEVSTFRLDEEARITLRYRNVKEADILAYRVDLMTLYLLQKNLNDIGSINLAGISPYYQEFVRLGDGKDYADKEYELELPLEEEGAYLLVAKEDGLDSSGMVLITPLTMEVEEDVVSGRVRVNVKNAESGRYENNAHVKVIGSGDTEFVSGSTDLRGIFVADNIHGAATVIARKEDRYAFYRGTAALQPPDMATTIQQFQAPADMRSQAMQQLDVGNKAIQMKSEGYLRKNLYQNTQLGVEVQATY